MEAHDPSELSRLSTSVDGLTDELSVTRGEIKGLRKETRAKVNRAWVGLTAVGVASVVALIAVSFAVLASDRAHDATVQLKAEREQRTLTACRQENVIRKANRDSKIQDANDLVATFRKFVPAGQSDPLAAFETDLLMRKQRTNVISFPYRDCSAGGVTAYYKHPPPDPAEGCKGDGKGFCPAS